MKESVVNSATCPEVRFLAGVDLRREKIRPSRSWVPDLV